MLKKFLKLIKKNEVVEKTVLPLDNKEELERIKVNEEIEHEDDETLVAIECEKVNETIYENIEVHKQKEAEDKPLVVEEVKDIEPRNTIFYDTEKIETEIIKEVIYNSNDLEFIKEAKIKRGMSIKAIDIYTKEEKIFKTHKECSKKLRIPIEYIKENLKYGYTDFFGEAIIYLNSSLQTGKSDINFDYLNNSKNPMELYSMLNSRIFTARISEKKRDMILSNDKIEPIKMHYRFECLDEGYDDYFAKYKSIIQRGGKKKIELVDKKGEAIKIFKSLEECSIYLNKEKSEVVDMLKYGETKAGRYEIRYSLRSI